MIRISRKGDYAVFILGYLAQRGAFPQPARDSAAAGGSPETAPTLCSAHEISEQTKLQRSIVANLLKELTRAGILHSERGIRGGYRLASEPDQISLGQILRIIEGPLTLVDCTHDLPAARAAHSGAPHSGAPHSGAPKPGGPSDGRCRLEGHCPSRSPMRFLHERIQRLIDEVRLPELCGLRAPAVVSSGPGRDPNSR